MMDMLIRVDVIRGGWELEDDVIQVRGRLEDRGLLSKGPPPWAIFVVIRSHPYP